MSPPLADLKIPGAHDKFRNVLFMQVMGDPRSVLRTLLIVRLLCGLKTTNPKYAGT